MEGGAHDVVVVTSEDGHARAGLPVPKANGGVIGRRNDPRLFAMELSHADII